MILIGCLIFAGCDTPGNVYRPEKDYFVKYYGHDGNQSGVDMVINGDGTITILGNTSVVAGESAITILTVDESGNIVPGSEKEYLGPGTTAVDIEAAGTGYVIVANEERALSPGQFTVRLLLVSSSGSVLKDATMDHYESQTVRSVTPASDGTFIITGQTSGDAFKESYPVGVFEVNDFFVARFDANLVEIDAAPLGIDLTGSGTKVHENAKGDFYYFGDSDKINNGGQYIPNFFYAGFSNNEFFNPGSPNFQSEANAGLPKRLADVQKVPLELGDGYVLVGSVAISATSTDFYVEKMKKEIVFDKLLAPQNFELQQRIPLGRSVTAVSVAPSLSLPQGYLLLGNTAEGTDQDSDILLVKISTDGQVLWQRGFGALGTRDVAGAVRELPDGRIVIVGTMNLDTENKIALIKINKSGDFLN